MSPSFNFGLQITKLVIFFLFVLDVFSAVLRTEFDHVAYDELSPYKERDIIDEGIIMPYVSMKSNDKIWVDARVPYLIDIEDSVENYATLIYVNKAIDAINDLNCVKFVEKQVTDLDYIHIQLGEFLSSHIGRQGGRQNVTIGRGPSNSISIVHVLYHVLGFGHEHNRPDRDLNITVMYDNIREESRGYFTKYRIESTYPEDNFPYDYQSIMHATSQRNPDLSIDPNLPIIIRKDGEMSLGQRDNFTLLDIARLKYAYSCDVCLMATLADQQKQETDEDDIPTERFFRYPGNCTKFFSL